MSFALNTLPVIYRAKYDQGSWSDEYLVKPHKKPEEEAALGEAERNALLESRNCYDDVPLVGFTSQYAMGCFEGIKALPQKGGGYAIFRPDRNAARFYNSMKGLYMPPFPADKFVQAVVETVRRNNELGFTVNYDEAWEKNYFAAAGSVYIRPFSYSEGGIGVDVSKAPSVFIMTTPVGSYFASDNSDGMVSDRTRATPKGTGWIKCASNYVISALAKHEAALQGFVECVFLDPVEHKYFEEGSSCNIFFYLKSGELVTPELGDTILPGITRSSLIELARDKGVKVSERRISVEEALSEAKECFLSGTAAGASPLTSLTYKGKKTLFNGGKEGEFTIDMRNTLKRLQYGLDADTKGWMVKV